MNEDFITVSVKLCLSLYEKRKIEGVRGRERSVSALLLRASMLVFRYSAPHMNM